jgi:hypothetical protein
MFGLMFGFCSLTSSYAARKEGRNPVHHTSLNTICLQTDSSWELLMASLDEH